MKVEKIGAIMRPLSLNQDIFIFSLEGHLCLVIPLDQICAMGCFAETRKWAAYSFCPNYPFVEER